MPLKTEELSKLFQIRRKYGDDVFYDAYAELYPDAKGTLGSIKQKYGATVASDAVFEAEKQPYKVSQSVWETLSPTTRQYYESIYSVQIGRPLKQQAEPEAVEQEPELPSYMGTEQYQYPSAGGYIGALKEDYGKYNKNIRQPILGKLREEKVKGQQQVGKLPTALQIEGLVFNRQSVGVPKEQTYQYPIEFGDKQQNRLTLVELAKNRMIPTYDQMKKELGDQRAKSLMNEIQKQYPSGLLTEETTARQRGKVIGLSKNPVIDAFASTAVQVFEEELSDPNEWIFELLPLGAIMSLGKRTATGSVKVGRGMIKNIPDALKKDIGGVRKRIIDEIFANYPGKQATQLVNDVAKITDNEIAETLANNLLDKVDLDEIVYDAQKRDILQQDITRAREEASTGHLGDATYRETYEQMQKRLQKEEIAKQAEQPEAVAREYYKFPEATDVKKVAPQDMATGAENVVAPDLPVTSAESIEDIIANSPSGKILDTPKLQSLAQEGDVLRLGDDSIAQIIGMGDDGEWKLRELEAPSLPVEPTKAELPTNIPEAETSAPEGQMAMPETPTGVVPEGQIAGEVATPKQAWEMTREEFIDDLVAQSDAEPSLPIPNIEYKNKKWRSIIDKNITFSNKRDAIEYAYDNLDNRYLKHDYAVQQALSEGKPVPAEVLADYPELAKVTDQVVPNQPNVAKIETVQVKNDFDKFQQGIEKKHNAKIVEDLGQQNNGYNYLLLENGNVVQYDIDRKLGKAFNSKGHMQPAKNLGTTYTEFNTKKLDDMAKNFPYMVEYAKKKLNELSTKVQREATEDIMSAITHEQVKGFYSMKDYTLGGYDAVNGEGSAQRAINDGLLTFDGDKLKLTESAKDDIFGVVPSEFKVKMRNGEPQIDTFFESAEVPPYAKRVKQSIHDGRPIVHAEIPYTNWKEFTETYPLYKGFEDMKAKAVVDVAQVEQAMPEKVDVVKVSDDYYFRMPNINVAGKIELDWEQAVDAKPVNNNFGVDLFLAKNTKTKTINDTYIVSEAVTGYRVGAGRTQKEAVENAFKRIEENKDILTKQFETVIKNNEISPRYKAPEAPAKAYVPDVSEYANKSIQEATRDIKTKRAKEKKPPIGQGLNIVKKIEKKISRIAKSIDMIQNDNVKDLIKDVAPKGYLQDTIDKIKAFDYRGLLDQHWKIKEVIKAEPFQEMWAASKKYGGHLRQTLDDYRTQVVPGVGNSMNQSSDTLVRIYGTMDQGQVDTFWDYVRLRTIDSNYDKHYHRFVDWETVPSKRGSGYDIQKFIEESPSGGDIGTRAKEFAQTKVPRRYNIDEIKTAIKEAEAILQSDDRGRQVLDATARYQIEVERVLDELKARGEVGDIIEQDFYFPRELLKYYVGYDSLPRRAQKQVRHYLKEAFGGDEDVVVNENVLRLYFAKYHLDNIIDDFALKARTDNDIFPTLLSSYTDDEISKLLGGHENIHKGSKYVIDGKTYVGSQADPSFNVFRDKKVNLKKLNDELEGWLIDNPDADAQSITDYITELSGDPEIAKSVLMFGKQNEVFLIPEPLEKMLNKIKSPSNDFMRTMARMTKIWKAVTLFQSGLPYQVGNVMGDGTNTFIEIPELIAYIPTFDNIVRHVDAAYVGKNIPLAPFEQRVLDGMIEKNVLGANMFELSPKSGDVSNALQWLHKTYNGFNFKRESYLRTLLFSYNLDRMEKGLPLKVGSMGAKIIGLDEMSANGYLARTIPVDYLDTPAWYRKYADNVVFPFITFRHKNAVNWARRYATKEGIKGTKALPLIATLGGAVAAYTWNTKGDPARRYAYKYLPEYIRKRGDCLVLKTYNDWGGKLPNRALVFAPVLPNDMAFELLGIDSAINYAKSVDLGLMTPKQAAEKYLADITRGDVGIPKMAGDLLNPLIKIFTSWKYNKDLYTGKPIYPNEAKNDPAAMADYLGGYWAKSLVTSIAPYVYEAGDSSAFKFTDIFEDTELIKQMTSNLRPDKAFSTEAKGPLAFLRAIGIYEVDLNAQKTRMITEQMEDSKWQETKMIDEWTNKYIEAIVDGNVSKFAKEISDSIERGDIAPEQVKIDGVVISENPEVFWDRFNKKFQDNLEKDKSIKSFLLKKKEPNAKKTYSQYRYLRALERVNRLPMGQQIDLLPTLMGQFDESSFDNEGDDF